MIMDLGSVPKFKAGDRIRHWVTGSDMRILRVVPRPYDLGVFTYRLGNPKNAIEVEWPSDVTDRFWDLVIPHDLTLRELQTQLPWTVHYHHDFRASPMTHKDFGHALLHVFKAAGKLSAVVNDAEHGCSEFRAEEVDRYVADLVVCALRMANTCPGRTIDLQSAVVNRIENKNSMELQGKK